MLKTFRFCVLLCTSAMAASAQVQTGMYPYSSYDAVGADSIDRGSLNIHLSIPVLAKQGRGLPFIYQLVFNSQIWTPVGTAGSQVWTPTVGFGLTGQLNEGFEGYLSYSTLTIKCYPQGGGSFTWQPIYRNYVYNDQFGVGHPFAYQYNSCTGVTTGAGASNDGSGYSYSGGSVTAANGKLINPPVNNQSSSGTITDANGNFIQNNGNGTFTDTLGKTALTITGSGTPSSPKYFTYNTPTGTAAATVNYQAYTVQTAFGCSGVTEYNLSQNLPSSVVLADGSTYTFTYEATPGVSGHVTGRVASITLPQGGTVTYQYTGGSNGIVCADGSAAGLTRSGDVSRTYVRSAITSSSSQTTITDGLNNTSVYNFVIANLPEQFYETSRVVNQGSSTVLLSRQTCYNNSGSSCTTTAITPPISQIDTYETLNGTEQHGATLVYNGFGLLTSQSIYDFNGASRASSPMQKETWTYPASGIANLVSFDSLVDGNGNSIGGVLYTYDETTGPGHAALVATSVPQHNAVSGQRGNLTTMRQETSTSALVYTASAYEDTGNPVSTAAPSNSASYIGSTTYAYDSATHAFAATVTLPTPTSGVLLQSSFSNDPNSGVLLTSTDLNQNTTTNATFDSLLRPTQVKYPSPGGGQVLTSYSPTGFGQNQYMTASTYTNTEVSLNTYGRLNWVAVQNGGGGYYWNNYCYDGNGNLQYAAYRFAAINQNNLSCSGAGDSYIYDALGRVTKITHGDNSTVAYSYNGRATKVTDENGVTRITQVDGLGRPTAVCEVSGSTLQGVAPGACGLDIGATGFLTTYVYSTDTGANNALRVTVTQGTQSRVFETDWLGRTTYTLEPERSTTTYSYSYSTSSGTGLVVTRQRGTADQSSPSNTTTTTTTNDILGRVLSVTYSDGTPGKYFGYDQSAGWSGVSPQTNMKGRLSTHIRYLSPGNASSIYGYDTMGRVILQASCQPSGCGNSAYNRQVNYTYNWAGMLTSESDGAGDTYTYSRSIAGEITGLTDSFSDATDPANLITPGSVTNGPFGPTSYSLGNGLNAINTYDTLGRLNGGWICSGSTSSGCTGGTQLYGYTAQRTGTHVTQTCDTVLNVCNSFGYDEFNRLTARTVNQGTVQNFTYTYDRFGNRWAQNAPQGGPTLSISFNPSNNIISTSGYTNDVPGNITNDPSHSYTYDADGNLTAVDGGSTATYYYDSLNQRIRIAPTRGTYEFVFDIFGRRVSNWAASSHGFVESNAYTDSSPIAIRSGGQRQYEAQNWIGSERIRTTYNGGTAIAIAELPWGDGHTPSGDNGDQHDFAGMDRDLEDNTEHAQYRQYSTNLGRWQSPDPFLGSYDFSNPQSLNRYSYALNDPVNLVDPSGLEDEQGCGSDDDCGGGDSGGGGGGGDGGDGGGDNGGTNAGDGDSSDNPVNPGNPFTIQQYAFSYQPVSDPFGYFTPMGGLSLVSASSFGFGGAAQSNGATVSSTVCTGAAVAAGTSAGALIGGGIGGGAGAIVGGAGGTVVAPGVGTVGGGVLGAEGGAGVGATVGGFIGGAIGGIVGNVLCSKGGAPIFGNNQRQNKQANDAKNAAERQTGKQFTPALERMFHDEVSGMNYSYQELVQIAVEILEMHG